MNRYGRVFQAGTQRRSVPNFQPAVQLAHSGKLGKLHTLYASVYTPANRLRLAARASPSRPATWSTGTSGWARPLAAVQPALRRRAAGAGYYDFDSGARLLDWGAHTVDLCQWANQADDTMPVEYEPTPNEHHRPLCQRREAGARFPQDAVRRASRLGQSPGHLPGPVRRRRGLGGRRATAARSRSPPRRSRAS